MKTDTPRTDAAWKAAFRSTSIDAENIRDFAQILERELNTLRWIPITERLPTIEDGDQFEDVEWSCGKEIWHGSFKNSDWHSPTHWRRITLP